jgi:HEAT repeat protein
VPGGSGSGPSTSGGDEDLTAWTFWWEFNKEPYLLLKDALGKGPPTTGSPDWFMGLGDKADGLRIARAVSDDQRRAIQEALLSALASEEHNDIVTGCLIALAKLGEVKEESGRSQLEEAFLPHLKSSSQEIAETAALALGILGNASAYPPLAHLLQDDAEGRELAGESEVPVRTRAFAAYALALLGARTAEEEVKRAIVQELVAALDSKASAMRDVAVACVISLGLVPVEPIDAPPRADGAKGADLAPAGSRAGQIAYLLAYLKDEHHHEIVRAHAPVALARLLADLPPEMRGAQRDTVVEALLARLDERARESSYVRQSAILALGQLGDADRDPLDARIRTGPIVATLLLGDVDDPARVHDVVGRVEHTGIVDPLGILRRGELVVGRSDHCGCLERRDGGGGEHRPEGTGREDVAGDRVGDGCGDDRRPGAGGDLGGGVVTDVGHGQPGPLGVQVVGQRGPDLPQAADADVAVLQRAVPPPLGHRPHRPEDPERGGGGGIAGPARGLAGARDVRGDGADEVHVGLGGADVLGGDVAPAEPVDEAGVGADELVGAQGGRIPEDHRLAAPLVEAGGGVLVGHPLGQAADVPEGLLLRGEGPEAGAPEARSEHGGVDGHDGAEAGGRIVGVGHLLEPLRRHDRQGS